MQRTIGVIAAERIAVGLVENSQLVGPVEAFPDIAEQMDYREGMPAEEIVERMVELIAAASSDQQVAAIGVGFPGLINHGLIEDSPNIPQIKGQNLGKVLALLLGRRGISAPLHILNDADALAAGIAATRGQLDKLIRVWTLGTGIGFGRYPQNGGPLEGGHIVVTLDPKENFCRCGGIGHLEGIMGYRAMRLRFLDLEPEEVFEQAQAGNERCLRFVNLWHRALAAAMATSIHLDGPGKFFISGPNARFVQLSLLHRILHSMVKMTPLQGSALELISTSDETAIIGAAVSALQSIARQKSAS
jgi:predicted NBD/HSP70 family sugar kinase